MPGKSTLIHLDGSSKPSSPSVTFSSTLFPGSAAVSRRVSSRKSPAAEDHGRAAHAAVLISVVNAHHNALELVLDVLAGPHEQAHILLQVLLGAPGQHPGYGIGSNTAATGTPALAMMTLTVATILMTSASFMKLQGCCSIKQNGWPRAAHWRWISRPRNLGCGI